MFKLLAGMLDLTLEDGELRNLRSDQLLPRVKSLPVIDKLDDFPEAEACFLPHADHLYPVDGVRRVATLPRHSRRWREEAFALVKTEGRHRRMGLRLELSDAQTNCHLT